ncbi:MAG: DNA-binding protein [Proteobacteria bacterium]|nr:DNA-binding protein [Pseudomonadota bacterium]
MPTLPLTPDERALALGDFLRARRESLDPARLGLPWIGVRRTPGLRREEVAQLAGIGITWYTKLEQGRPVRASTKVLMSIAEALQCSEAETAHLFTLAGLGKPQLVEPPVCAHISVSAQRILEQLNPIPASIQNARFDIIGFNQAYCRLVNVDLASIPPEDCNCIYLAFTCESWRSAIADWPSVMPRMVALFRATMAEHPKDSQWEVLLQRLLDVSADFRETWARNEVYRVENHLKRFAHPEVGPLLMHQTNWWSAPRNGDRLLVFVPADAPSEQALRRLNELPAPISAKKTKD